MAERKPEWSESGDLEIATIETVTDYGAYTKLDEYGKRSLFHVSTERCFSEDTKRIVSNDSKSGGQSVFRREK
jgi:predicted RNA-binding protein with RPS1 domain